MRNFLLRMSLQLAERNIFPIYEDLLKRQFSPLETNLRTQEERLKNILLHAWKYVPYYRQTLEEAGVVRNGIVNLDAFGNIPALTKQIIRESFDDLQSTDAGREKRKPYTNTSGGSTGEPVKFTQDNISWANSMAGKWLFYAFGTRFPCKHLKLWGSERDILHGSFGVQGGYKNWIYHRKFLNTYRMSEEFMLRYVTIINQYRPVMIDAYIDSIFELSRYIEKNNLPVFSPKVIFASAGTVYPDQKALIEKVFRCRLLDRYGSREVGDVACSTPNHDDLHLNIFNHYTEILDENMRPCAPGETGRIYVTTFHDYTMPLIRFDIGDVAVQGKQKPCSCGRGLPTIRDVIGRSTDMIRTRKGTFSGTALTTSMYHYYSIRKYQFVQKERDHIKIRLVLNDPTLWETDRGKLEAKLKQTLGDDVRFTFQVVPEIPPLQSGKYLFFINEVDG